MKLLALTLFKPGQAFSGIRSSSPWRMAILAVILAWGILFVLLQPYVINVTLSHLPPSAGETDRNAIREYLSQDLIARLILLPIRIGGGIAVFAFVLRLLSKSLQPFSRIPFPTIFSLLVHAECINILAHVAAWISVATAPGASSGLSVPFSLAGMAGDHIDFQLHALLNSLNIFTLWYLTLVATGLVSLFELKRWKAAAAVCIIWGLSQLVSIASLSFLRNTLHLLL